MPQQSQDEWEDLEWEDVDTEEPVVTPPAAIPPRITAPPQSESMLGRAWNAITTPLTDAPSRFARSVAGIEGGPTEGGIMDAIGALPDIGRNMINEPMATLKGFGQGVTEGVGNLFSQETSPLALASTAIGMPRPVRQGIGKGIRGIASRVLGKADDVPVPTARPPVSFEPSTPELVAPGPSVSPMFNPRGQTGMTGTAQLLPRELQGAKPRFNIGQNSYTPQFESDIDKALFIIAQKTPSARNSDYLEFVMKHTGLDESQAVSEGIKVRSRIKSILSDEEPGDVKISTIWKPKSIASEMTGTAQATPKVQPNIWLKNPTPEKVKQAAEQGYKFGGKVREDGAFSMVKSDKPLNVPMLESEVGGARPTKAGAQQHLRHQLGPVADVKKSSAIAEAINFPRGVMASWDFSAPLRQGVPLIGKKAWWTSFDDMFKSWGSENAFQAVQKSIADKPLFRPRVGPGNKQLPSFAEDAGLKLTDLTDLSKREEAVMSTWAEKVPGVRRSNRAYVAFLNKLRADTFEDLIKKGKVLGADGEANIPLAREIANFVNTSTGRGSLGSLEQSAVALNSTFFSPRLIASRLTMLNPHYYWSASPMVRKEALKALFSVAAAGSTIGQLGRMAGGTVESDPTSSDFGKIKIGNTRIDPFAGFQQYVVLANRLLEGRTKSTVSGREYNLGEEFGRPTKLDVLGRFAEGKLHPVLSFATGLLRGKDFTGQPFNVPQEVANRVMPIIIQDIIELANEDPTLLPLAIPASLGMGIQSYESQ